MSIALFHSQQPYYPSSCWLCCSKTFFTPVIHMIGLPETRWPRITFFPAPQKSPFLPPSCPKIIQGQGSLQIFQETFPLPQTYIFHLQTQNQYSQLIILLRVDLIKKHIFLNLLLLMPMDHPGKDTYKHPPVNTCIYCPAQDLHDSLSNKRSMPQISAHKCTQENSREDSEKMK